MVGIREDQLTIGKLLGEGNFGKVFAGEYRGEHGESVNFIEEKIYILLVKFLH